MLCQKHLVSVTISLSFGVAYYVQIVLAATIPLPTNGDIALAWFAEADYHVPEINASIPLFDSEKSYRISRDLDRAGVYSMLEKIFRRQVQFCKVVSNCVVPALVKLSSYYHVCGCNDVGSGHQKCQHGIDFQRFGDFYFSRHQGLMCWVSSCSLYSPLCTRDVGLQIDENLLRLTLSVAEIAFITFSRYEFKFCVVCFIAQRPIEIARRCKQRIKIKFFKLQNITIHAVEKRRGKY